MKIIGCDFHPSFQQIAMVDTETGEYTERKLTAAEARPFYAGLQGAGDRGHGGLRQHAVV